MENNDTFTGDLRPENGCRILNLAAEYPGYSGEIRWAVFSDRSEKELTALYGKALEKYRPYICMTMDQYRPFKNYRSNEQKHRKRMECTYENFENIEQLEGLHADLSFVPEDPFEYEELYRAISMLTPLQKTRIYQRYFLKMSLEEIGGKELSAQAVAKSVDNAVRRLGAILAQDASAKRSGRGRSTCLLRKEYSQ